MSAILEAAEQKLWNGIRLRSRGSQTPDWRETHDNAHSQDKALPSEEYFCTGRRQYHSVPADQRIRYIHIETESQIPSTKQKPLLSRSFGRETDKKLSGLVMVHRLGAR